MSNTTFLNIQTELKEICKAFNLGNLKSWRTEEPNFKGYHLATFNTTKESNLKHYFKIR